MNAKKRVVIIPGSNRSLYTSTRDKTKKSTFDSRN